MTEPEIKMENYDQITKLVVESRTVELEQRNLGKQHGKLQEKLEELGITCNNVTNCVDVGKFCYKCKNNYARRSYFRDLLQKGADVGIYAMNATCFDAVEPNDI